MLDSYSFIDKIDVGTMDRAERHANRVNTNLSKIKKDIIKTHISQFKHLTNGQKNTHNKEYDVQAIPEKANNDDPFGLIDKASNNDSGDL